MSGIYGNNLEDRHFERVLNKHLEQDDEEEYLYPPEEEFDLNEESEENEN